MNPRPSVHPSPSKTGEAADDASMVARCRRVLQIEAQAVAGLIDQLDAATAQAVRAIYDLTGRLVVTGMGKSGHVARKIAATFASTGTPALFVHPAEAQHGDLGMIQANDLVLAFSYSGETDELRLIAPHIKRMGARLIAVTGHAQSTLARLADIHLNAAVKEEACPLNLAPTASTTAALALGDALAVAVLEMRGFRAEDFAKSHPGGSLGRRLLVRVADVMRTGDQIPRVAAGTLLTDALAEMGAKRMGMTCVVDAQGRAQGIFTDGDLRRLLGQNQLTPDLTVDQVMTRSAQTISAEALATEAAHQMDATRINHLLIVNDQQVLIGAIGLHDLLEAKIL
jgi:arabinose-5-phosphate isomerase